MSERDDLESVPTRTAFVVWLGRDAAGRFEGIVERARTGEKRPFQGLESLAPLIGRMSEATPPSPPKKSRRADKPRR
jgi:hypothetical protein